MSEDRRSIDEIEAELERQRLALNANLAALKDRMTPGGIAQEAIGLLNIPTATAAAGVIGSLGGAIRSSPASALLAGAGLLWLVARPTGPGKTKAAVAGRSSLGAAMSAAAALANVVAALEPEEIRAAAAEVDRISRAGAAKLREIDDALRKGAGDMAESLRDGSRQVGEAAAEAKAKFESGVGGLSEDASAAVAAARESALRTKQKAKRLAGDAQEEVAAFVERHPLAAGAGAAATGVLIAALLGAGRDKRQS